MLYQAGSAVQWDTQGDSGRCLLLQIETLDANCERKCVVLNALARNLPRAEARRILSRACLPYTVDCRAIPRYSAGIQRCSSHLWATACQAIWSYTQPYGANSPCVGPTLRWSSGRRKDGCVIVRRLRRNALLEFAFCSPYNSVHLSRVSHYHLETAFQSLLDPMTGLQHS